MSDGKKANIVVIGAGWWSQGWHLPHLSRNPNVRIAAVVERSAYPKSNLDPHLASLSDLGARYGCPTYSSTEELLSDPDLAGSIDGAIVCTPHSTHAEIGATLLREGMRRLREGGGAPLSVLMEKPLTTDIRQAMDLRDLVKEYRSSGGKGCFLVNHSANFRSQAREARRLVESGTIGAVRHVEASFASPLSWIFDDPANTGWNEPDGLDSMVGNGFGWGQSSHVLAWVYHVTCGKVRPRKVYCAMTHSDRTGADVAHAATVRCDGGATFSLSGTSLLPGSAHSDPPVGKRVRIQIFGTEGALIYCGDDRDPASGRLELRRGGDGNDAGRTDVICPELGFQFEDLERDGIGPESLRSFVAACLGEEDYYVGADGEVGLMTVRTIDAMYRSHRSGEAEDVL